MNSLQSPAPPLKAPPEASLEDADAGDCGSSNNSNINSSAKPEGFRWRRLSLPQSHFTSEDATTEEASRQKSASHSPKPLGSLVDNQNGDYLGESQLESPESNFGSFRSSNNSSRHPSRPAVQIELPHDMINKDDDKQQQHLASDDDVEDNEDRPDDDDDNDDDDDDEPVDAARDPDSAPALPWWEVDAAAAATAYHPPTTATTTANDDISEADSKAHTFRKRRLSLTQNNLHAMKKCEDNSMKRRRFSEASSVTSCGSLGSLAPKTLHSDEIIAEHAAASASAQSYPSQYHAQQQHPYPMSPPMSPMAMAQQHLSHAAPHFSQKHQHVLYRPTAPQPPPMLVLPRDFGTPPPGKGNGNQDLNHGNHHHHLPFQPSSPSKFTGYGASSEDGVFFNQSPTATRSSRRKQPKWKRVHTVTAGAEHKLPFPREIVGTYSCHGVEPIYEEDLAMMMRNQHEHVNHLMMTTAPTTIAKINQDRGGVIYPYGNLRKTALFAVYDGHGLGGESVSQYALNEIPRRLKQHPAFPNNLERAFQDTFLAVDEALRSEPLIDPLFAGTTACVALIRDRQLTVANVGDSRAVLAQKVTVQGTASSSSSSSPPVPPRVLARRRAVDITFDQNPDLPEERSRILRAGGYVSPSPGPGLSSRVWLDPACTQIGLAMARSIGDHAVTTVGVIAEPVVTCHEIDFTVDDFVILASDGVWEFLSSQDAVDTVAYHLQQGRGAAKACQALIEAASARWYEEEGEYRDDITAIVICLADLWKHSSNNKINNKSKKKHMISQGQSDLDRTGACAGDGDGFDKLPDGQGAKVGNVLAASDNMAAPGSEDGDDDDNVNGQHEGDDDDDEDDDEHEHEQGSEHDDDDSDGHEGEGDMDDEDDIDADMDTHKIKAKTAIPANDASDLIDDKQKSSL